MRISDWSSDVCSSDLAVMQQLAVGRGHRAVLDRAMGIDIALVGMARGDTVFQQGGDQRAIGAEQLRLWRGLRVGPVIDIDAGVIGEACLVPSFGGTASGRDARSEERRGGKGCVRPCRSRWSPYY